MNPQHLSDEAVAAFADGVLSGHARERATRHAAACAECAQAVKVQREAAWALRAAPAPSLPTGLLDRLRCVPQTTPITTLPTVVAPDGSTMLSTVAPMAALVPATRVPPTRTGTIHRGRTIVTTAAAVALAGALTAGSVSQQVAEPTQPARGSTVLKYVPNRGSAPGVIAPVSVFRTVGH
jgi:anti-sigma factor RsiW